MFTVGGISQRTQCNILKPVSKSTTAKLFVSAGPPFHSNGGDLLSPIPPPSTGIGHLYFGAIDIPIVNMPVYISAPPSMPPPDAPIPDAPIPDAPIPDAP